VAGVGGAVAVWGRGRGRGRGRCRAPGRGGRWQVPPHPFAV